MVAQKIGSRRLCVVGVGGEGEEANPIFLQWENLRTPSKIHSEYTKSDNQVFIIRVLCYGTQPHWKSQMQPISFKENQLLENLY